MLLIGESGNVVIIEKCLIIIFERKVTVKIVGGQIWFFSDQRTIFVAVHIFNTQTMTNKNRKLGM